MIDEQAREKKLLAMARRKARVIVEIKWLLKRGIKVKGHDDLKELHLPEIDRRLREIDGTVELNY